MAPTKEVLSSWESFAHDLQENGGYAQVPLSEEQQEQIARGFQIGRRALEESSNKEEDGSNVRCIGPTEDSAHATGYHPSASSNSMSRYNAHREGFVFSDGATLPVKELPDFEPSMTQLQTCLHGIANQALASLEKDLLKLPANWFQENFSHEENHSQWHLKRYVFEPTEDDERTSTTATTNNHDTANSEEKKEEEQQQVLLPSHTDPSLLSVVILDQPGTQPGAMGLQYYQKVQGETKKRVWTELPFHGHAVATIFVGSVLSHITGARCASAKHRVVHRPNVRERMAATFFLRPSGSALLSIPPSPVLEGVTLKKQTTFDTWSARVSRNYMSNKKTQQSAPHKANLQQRKPPQGYFRDAYTEVSLHGMYDPDDPALTKLTGREKYLGGELGTNGKIYCIPGYAERVLVVDPSTEPPTIKHIGPRYKGEYKWLRAVRLNTGIILGLPCHADSILRIDPETDHVSTIEWDTSDPKAPPLGMPWKYHGGGLAPLDNCLYCIPQFAETIMKVDPATEEVSFFGGPFPGKNKWYGGLIGKSDGAIYGVCQNATGVLRIDPSDQTATVHGNFHPGGYKWHGGTIGPDGCIYSIPSHADSVLKIEPGNPPRLSTFGGPLRSGQHRSDGKYKYLGGAVGRDGNVYFFPSDSDYVLQIDPRTETVKEVGPNLREVESIHHNKWQNGFSGKDGCIYGIPLKSSSVIRIRPSEDGKEADVTTIGGPFPGLNKWEGGVMGNDGVMYCMPLNNANVLRIEPIV